MFTLKTTIILYIICGWFGRCLLPQPPAPVAEVAAAPSADSPTSFSGIGNPFVGITDKDTGYCGDDLSGSGWSGSLLWPVEGAVNDGRGFRVGHTALDINGYTGQPVLAASAGRVVFYGWSSWGFGNLVVLSHGGGWMTFYAHLTSPPEVMEQRVGIGCGAEVMAGQLIGYVGQSGAATWPHLHFELRNGRTAYDPAVYLID